MSDLDAPAPKPPTSKPGTDLKTILARKIGPLPVGWWIAGIGAGLALAYMRARNTAAEMPNGPSAADLETGSPLGVGSPDDNLAGAYGTGGAAYSDPYRPAQTPAGTGMADPTLDAGAISDNNAWRVAAVKAAGGNGISQTDAERAISVYLQGGRLTYEQAQIINGIASKVGPTPDPVPAPSVAPLGGDPAPTSTPAGTIPGNNPTSNPAWRVLAANRMQAAGYSRANTDRALANYLAGKTVSAHGGVLVREAIAKTGAPPKPTKPLRVQQPKAAKAHQTKVPAGRRDNGQNKPKKKR